MYKVNQSFDSDVSIMKQKSWVKIRPDSEPQDLDKKNYEESSIDA